MASSSIFSRMSLNDARQGRSGGLLRAASQGTGTMQQSDIEASARLLELANDGVDDEEWREKFTRHVEQVLETHNQNLMSGGSAAEQRLEVLRARLELNEFVMERIQARSTKLDRGGAEALEELRAMNAPLIEEILGCKPSDSGVCERRPDLGDHTDSHFLDGRHSSGSLERVGAATAFAAVVSRRRAEPQSWRRRGVTSMSSQSSPASTQGKSPQSPFHNVFAGVSLGFARSELENLESDMPVFAGGATSCSRSPTSPTSPTDSKLVRTTPSGQKWGRGYAAIHSSGTSTVQNKALLSGIKPPKELSLRQLRQVIRSIYESKAQHDTRCRELQEPTETMEQHLYAFLAKRYHHTKPAIQEWTQAIFRAIVRFSPHECEVTMFGKILQNCLAESFATMQETLKASVQMFLKRSLQTNSARRSQAETDATWRSWMAHGVPYSECEKVVQYLYNERDTEVALNRIFEAKSEPDSVGYRDLMQTLLRFQMELTEGFLDDFCAAFAGIDTDKDGVLNNKEVKELAFRVGGGVVGGDARTRAALCNARRNTLQVKHIRGRCRRSLMAGFPQALAEHRHRLSRTVLGIRGRYSCLELSD
eukprot:TRINITY_DN9611_c0_g2_i1.p1 TRINITY_DN9611_c0_g2~~TRINITY_DN9611_c0_g2_i1.p1  ORF type:complete len:607 (+),score=68.71 TRINITY_DN9611_c0_g2_i1:45-1823(+)